MKYGFSKPQLEEIVKIISTYTKVEEAILFGSRAIDTFKEASDVDIALKGQKVSHKLVSDLKFYFEEETELPFFFDLLSYSHINNNNKLKQHIDKYGIVIYRKGWKKVKLKDLAVLHYGKYLPERNRIFGTIPVYSAAGITAWHIKALIKSRGIIIGRKETIGSVYKSDVPFFPINTTFYISETDIDCNLNFLFYTLSNLGLNNLNSDLAVSSLNRNTAYIQEFYLPPFFEQEAIAEVLSSLDDKIELLHKQNKTLENIAQTIFHKCFIEDAKDEWDEGFVADEFNFTIGLSSPENYYNEAKERLPILQGNTDIGFRFPKNRRYAINPKRVAEAFNTLISVPAAVGEQNMALEKSCIGRGISAFKYKNNETFYAYTYYKMKSLISEIRQFNQIGTVQDFNNFPIKIPPVTVLKNFQNTVKPVDDKVILNCIQIRKIETLRDTLLPKLMNGKVKCLN